MNDFARRHPQLSLEEMQQLKWLLGGLLTLLSASTVFYLDIDAWILTALTTVSVIANLARPTWLARVPRWVHRLSFPFIAGFFAIDLWVTGELLPPMVRLDVLLLLYRSIIYRQKRDDLQLVVLGLFLVVVAGVLTVSMVFALQILVFAAMALIFLLAVTLTDWSGDAEISVPPEPGVAPAWARHVHWRRLLERVRHVTDWRVLVFASGLFVGLVAVSGLLFLAIPRFQLENGLFLERFITKKAHTGFSDTIRFGDVTDIQQDTSVALSVDVSDRSQVPNVPYWRMLVLDEYRDGTFRLSPILLRDAFDRERSGMLARGPLADHGGSALYWTFYLESGVSRFLPTLGSYEVARFREPQTFRTARQLGVVALRTEPVTMMAYRLEGLVTESATVDVVFGARLSKGRNNPRALAPLLLQLGIGESDRAVLQRIAAEVTQSLGAHATLEPTPAADAFAAAASAWLAERHVYSLQPKIPAGAGDPLVRWLDSREGGHCELFAGSLALLARTAGIPARIVTGFRGGSWNGYSNNFTLRNSDAHAWCELFDARTNSWHRADPTPGARSNAESETKGEATLARRVDRSWTARLDSLRVFWYRRIVSFDQQSQFETLRAVKEATENSGKQLRASLERIATELKNLFATPWDLRRLGAVAGILTVLAGLIWAGRRLRFAMFAFSFSPRLRRDPVRAEAGRWLARFSQAGVDARRDDGSDEAVSIIRELQRLRYGARETWSEPDATFRRARSIFKRAKRLRPSTPRSAST